MLSPWQLISSHLTAHMKYENSILFFFFFFLSISGAVLGPFFPHKHRHGGCSHATVGLKRIS